MTGGVPPPGECGGEARLTETAAGPRLTIVSLLFADLRADICKDSETAHSQSRLSVLSVRFRVFSLLVNPKIFDLFS
jgi:hypothetical protein